MPDVNPSQSAFTLSRTSDVVTNAQGTTISMVYVGPQDAAIKAAFYAAHPLGEAHSAYTLSELSEYREKLIGGSGDTRGMVEISLEYKPSGATSSGVLGLMRPGESTLESDSNAVEHPIEKVPPEYFRTATAGSEQSEWEASGNAATLKAGGIESWIDPQPTVTRTDAVESSSFSFTESEITGDVGTVMTSSAMAQWGVLSAAQDDDGNSKWLYTNKRITKNGETVTITRTAQYNREGWEMAYVYNGGGSETPENP
jgi:hypothetical protein